ncbi:MAG: prolyl oligopeptidase family serine peptidase, partial [Bacteroidota bacterium]
MKHYHISLTVLLLYVTASFGQIGKEHFSYLDVFALEYAVDPQISPDGTSIVYRRTGFDTMKDRATGKLWMLTTDGKQHVKLTSREVTESSPRWSPDGDRLAFISSTDEGAEIYMYWVTSGKIARISQLAQSPSSLSWSPDGKWLAFSMNVPEAPPVIAKMPKSPKGAKWAAKPRITDRLKHEADGRGYIAPGFQQLFVIPATGGTPRQLTSGKSNHSGQLSWSPDGNALYFSSNRNEDWEYDFVNSEIYKVTVATGNIDVLTNRKGPDYAPVASPDGNYVAYISFEDKVQAYQVRELYIMNTDGSGKRSLTSALDRSVSEIQWDAKSKKLYFTYTDKGNTKIATVDLNGNIKKLADDLGGTSIGRPYPGGSYSVSENGSIAYTHSRPDYPADVALLKPRARTPQLLTRLNNDLLSYRNLGSVEEVWYTSSVDGRALQGWLVKPPNHESDKTYPLLVEIHGGPILNYGDRFSAEMQLYAAAGYVVFYPNPRGSTGYGEEFGNLLYNNYPGDDYNDIMDGVDYLISKGITSEDQLYVTGGSAGGIMTA